MIWSFCATQKCFGAWGKDGRIRNPACGRSCQLAQPLCRILVYHQTSWPASSGERCPWCCRNVMHSQSRLPHFCSAPWTVSSQLLPWFHTVSNGELTEGFPKQLLERVQGQAFARPVEFWEGCQASVSAETNLARGQLCRASRNIQGTQDSRKRE